MNCASRTKASLWNNSETARSEKYPCHRKRHSAHPKHKQAVESKRVRTHSTFTEGTSVYTLHLNILYKLSVFINSLLSLNNALFWPSLKWQTLFLPPQHVTPFILTTFADHNSSLKRMTEIINNRKNFFFWQVRKTALSATPLPAAPAPCCCNLDLFILCSNTSTSTADVMTTSLFFRKKLKSTVDPKVKIYILPRVSLEYFSGNPDGICETSRHTSPGGFVWIIEHKLSLKSLKILHNEMPVFGQQKD